MPVIFQFQLLTSWGDPYYIGLTGLELYDEWGDRIPLSENSILSQVAGCFSQTREGLMGCPHSSAHCEPMSSGFSI